jgi:hypothetical protein
MTEKITLTCIRPTAEKTKDLAAAPAVRSYTNTCKANSIPCVPICTPLFYPPFQYQSGSMRESVLYRSRSFCSPHFARSIDRNTDTVGPLPTGTTPTTGRLPSLLRCPAQPLTHHLMSAQPKRRPNIAISVNTSLRLITARPVVFSSLD